MAKERLTDNISIDFGTKNPEWKRIRTSPEMKAYLDAIGQETVARCNASLHAAQAARNQPQEDGYAADVVATGDRARLNINPTTARAKAHEAVHHDILKNLPIGGVPESPAPDRSVAQELGRRGAESSGWGGQ